MLDSKVEQVDADLMRLSAACRLCVKHQRGGSWECVIESVATFAEAFRLASEVENVVEVGIFIAEHAMYSGIIIWTSRAPEVFNRFDHYD